MNKDEIFCYIRDNFWLDDSLTGRLVWNIVEFLIESVQNTNDRVRFAETLFDGLGFEEEELRKLFTV